MLELGFMGFEEQNESNNDECKRMKEARKGNNRHSSLDHFFVSGAQLADSISFDFLKEGFSVQKPQPAIQIPLSNKNVSCWLRVGAGKEEIESQRKM